MSAPTQIPGELLTEVHSLLAEMGGFLIGVTKAMPALGDIASPLARRAEKCADRLRDYTARTILAEHLSGGDQ